MAGLAWLVAIAAGERLEMKDKKPRLGEILVERGVISPEDLAKALGAQKGIPCINPGLLKIDPGALRLVSEAIARHHNLIPISVNDDVMQLAVADADDILVLDALTSRTRKKIVPLIATADEIKKAIDDNYQLPVPDKEIVVPYKEAPGVAAPAAEAGKADKVTDGGVKSQELERVFSGLDFASPSSLETAAGELSHKREEFKNLFSRLEIMTEPEPEAGAVISTLGQSLIDLNTCPIQPEALKLIPEGIARKFDVIPIRVMENVLQVAATDADDITTLEALTAWARMRIELVVADRDDIRRAIDRNYKAYAEIEKQFKTEDPRTVKEDKTASESVTNAPVVRALDLLMKEAIKNHSSDIHIEPTEKGIVVRYRIDGVLHEAMTLPTSAQSPLISRLKIMANMNIADQRRPQDGQFSIMVTGRRVDVRVATIFTAYGEMAVLRILDTSFAGLSLDQLGFSRENLAVYGKMLKFPFGMILISGPTGSGKTTTLYASLKSLDCKGRKIITVEDPVEYRYQNISQVQINPRAGLTFATGLRAIMRLDPDVILVGEVRDPETAEIAVQAALTGHLVMASIHANDAVGAIFRLLDLGVPPYLVSSSLAGSVAQRMVRRICHKCRDFRKAPVEARLAYCQETGEERTEFYYGRGCNSCANTGYQGRVAAFEMLTMSDEIRTRILAGAGSDQIRAQALKEGMSSMWHDGMLKVKAGITTPCEILRNVFSSD
ncbi:MAG: type II/IV secretion system protein [Chloroflexota bacterium]